MQATNYTHLNFESLSDYLRELLRTYYPNTYRELSDSDPMMGPVKLMAALGDIGRFYGENQFQEASLLDARDRSSHYKFAYQAGFDPLVTSPSLATVDFIVSVPALFVSGSYVPNPVYLPVIQPGSQFISRSKGITFLLSESVNFNEKSARSPRWDVYDTVTGNMQVKKTGIVFSAEYRTKQFTVGTTADPYLRLILEDESIIGVDSVYDLRLGQNWQQVRSLAEDRVLSDEIVPSSVYRRLTGRSVSRRFTARFESDTRLVIEFGGGYASTHTALPGDSPLSMSTMATRFLPQRGLSMGEVPLNTTLEVRYLVGGGSFSNVAAEDITIIGNLIVGQRDADAVPVTFQAVVDSLFVINREPASGGRGPLTIPEFKRAIQGALQASDRAVTLADYEAMCRRMPPRYGSVEKVYARNALYHDVVRNQYRSGNSVEIFVLSLDENNRTISTNSLISENLKEFLSQVASASDTISVLPAYVINFGVEFRIGIYPGYDKNRVQREAIQAVASIYDTKDRHIGDALYKQDIYSQLIQVEGVRSVHSIRFIGYNGTVDGRAYSAYAYDFDSFAGSDVVPPPVEPTLFELRYPEFNIYCAILD